MFGFLLTLMILDGILLMVVVLLQEGKGDGLAAVGGSSGIPGAESLIGGRQTVTLLTRTTWVTSAIFLILAMVLAVLSSRTTKPNSILRGEFQQQTTPAAPQPVLPAGAATTGAGAAIPGTTPAGQAKPKTGAGAATTTKPAGGATTKPGGGGKPKSPGK